MEKYIVVEVGANLGQDTDRFINMENSKVWVIEPVPFLLSALKEKYKDRTNASFHQIAISDYIGESKFGISNPEEGAKDWGCSSLNEFADNIKDVWDRGDFNMIEYINVPVTTMKQFVIDNNINVIDYLHCDAQGSDILVLKSFEEKLSIVKAGSCEASNKIKLYKGVDNSATTIIDFLKSNNFKIDKIMGDNWSEIKIEDLPNSPQYECNIHFSKI
jgi:FkbM family methyltransferase